LQLTLFTWKQKGAKGARKGAGELWLQGTILLVGLASWPLYLISDVAITKMIFPDTAL
jgi:hypothetical protein